MPRLVILVLALLLQGLVAGSSLAEEMAVIPRSQAEMRLSFAPLVKRTAPAVVNVYAEKIVDRSSLYGGDPFFDEFFGQQMPNRSQTQTSLGSGVIIDGRGYVITNNHVIAGADEIKVALSDGREFAALLVLKDERTDLAVLKIKAEKEKFVSLPLGDSDSLEVGDLVLAIGNPFGVGQTVTSGIVSGLARSRIGEGDFGFFIQTDASINPGNSGGALINMEGELIGINTAIMSRGGGSNGVGFAIPANLVRVFVAAAIGGRSGFQRPFVGATFSPVTSDVVESLGLTVARGALVTKVLPDSPAAKAGLKPGDVVQSVNGIPVEHPDALGYRLTTAGIGVTVTLGVTDGGKAREVALALDSAPETTPRDERLIDGRNPFAGALVANLSPRLAEELKMPDSTTGVVVLDVSRGSPAARVGFETGDIIAAINGETVDTTKTLAEIAGDDADFWRVEIIRGGIRIRQFIR